MQIMLGWELIGFEEVGELYVEFIVVVIFFFKVVEFLQVMKESVG